MLPRNRNTRLLNGIRLTFTDPWEVFGSLALITLLVALLIIVPPLLAHSQRRRDQNEDTLLTVPRVAGTLLALLSAAIIIVRPMVAIERPVLVGFDFHGGSVTESFATGPIFLPSGTALAIVGRVSNT